jgi:hypothetical protein
VSSAVANGFLSAILTNCCHFEICFWGLFPNDILCPLVSFHECHIFIFPSSCSYRKDKQANSGKHQIKRCFYGNRDNWKKVIYVGFETLSWITKKLTREWIELARGLCTLCDFVTRESCILALEWSDLCRQDVSVWVRTISILQIYSWRPTGNVAGLEVEVPMLESQAHSELSWCFILVVFVSMQGYTARYYLEINYKRALNPAVLMFTVHCHNLVSWNRALSLPFKKRRYSFKMRHKSAGQRI